MKLQNHHMEAFRNAGTDRLIRRMADHLPRTFPKQLAEHDLAGVDLVPVLQKGMERAQSYGVEDEGDLERYFEFMAILGPDFDSDSKHAWAGETLKRSDLDADGKMDEIGDHIVFSLSEPPSE